jgi:hypothetical protein
MMTNNNLNIPKRNILFFIVSSILIFSSFIYANNDIDKELQNLEQINSKIN